VYNFHRKITELTLLDRGCVELVYDKYIMEVVIEAEHHHHHHHDCGLFGYLVRKFKDKGEEGIHCTCIIPGYI
jgi:hypothetical protein